MSNFKEKSQVFLLGLMFGLLIGCGFFIFKLDDYFKELSFYKNAVKTFSDSFKNEKQNTKTDEAQFVKTTNPNNDHSKNKTIPSVDSGKLKTTQAFLATDTMAYVSLKDTMTEEGVMSDNIIVQKDELITTKTLEVININPASNRSNAKDSLLQKISGIRDDKNNVKQFLNIEFWQSPLHYKGYKLGKYKLILYGITIADEFKIYTLDDIVYLKNVNTTYKLSYGSDFKQYERVTDENIINKLK